MTNKQNQHNESHDALPYQLHINCRFLHFTFLLVKNDISNSRIDFHLW